MKLDSKKALKLLNNAKGMAPDDNWITHSICVGNCAAKIAQKLNLDEDCAKTLGYIHDIGKRNSFDQRSISHTIAGYEYLIGLGYDEDYASVCLTHSYLNNDINCVAGGIPDPNNYRYEFIKDYVKNHQYTIYEKIINLSDLLCKQKNMTLEKRLIEIMIRRGVHENTIYHIKEAQKLKKEIDKMLDCSVYCLLDNIEI